MKKILIYTIIGSIFLGSFTSCDDLLKEEPYGNPTAEDMLKDEDNFILLVGQIYTEIKWLHDHWGYWGLRWS